MVHDVLLFVAPVDVDPCKVAKLHDSLQRGRAQVDRGLAQHYPGRRPLPLPITPEALPMLHFASIQVFDSQPLSETAWSLGYLVFECCIDGPADAFVRALAALDAKHGSPLAGIFAQCRDFVPGTDLYAYLMDTQRLRRPDLLHIGIPGMRCSHVRWGEDLRRQLDEELDRLVLKARAGDDPIRIIEGLRRRLDVPDSPHPHLHYTRRGWITDPPSLLLSRLWHWSRATLAVLLAAIVVFGILGLAGSQWGIRGVLLAAIAEVAVAGLVWKWLHGRNNSPIFLERKGLGEVLEREDHVVQNHMCTFTLIQHSALRRFAVRAVLRSFNLAYRTLFTDITPGRLSGLPTIHFAHWTIVPLSDKQGRPTGREALLFLSNYDGSWDAYLDDFIDFLFSGVVAIWASCERFRWPLTHQIFKTYARNGMTPWQCWYVGAPGLTVLNVHNNNELRKGLLQKSRTTEEARLWLARLGRLKDGHETIPDPDTVPTLSDVQGLVMSGYRHLPWSSHVPLQITDTAGAQRWLQALVPQVTDGRARPHESKPGGVAANVAFTWRGLAALGLPRAARDAFPLAFQEGIAPGSDAHRSRALGDTCLSAPDSWAWGGSLDPSRQVDVLLMLYAATEHERRALEARWVYAFSSAIRPVVDPIRGEIMPSGTPGGHNNLIEHFGFVDGISQPAIAGTWHVKRPERAAEAIKPGEFLLGYPTEDGMLSPGVPVPARQDPRGLLPASPVNARVRDFGRNGSYLVARQLHQHVADFRRFVAAAPRLTGPGSFTSEAFAARLIGRTPAGVPLTVNGPPEAPNDFAFTDDPHGFGCPVGAHIRRANPRASLQQNPAAALAATRRRRLLRRGRTYGTAMPPDQVRDDDVPRGMMFVCLNSDIERQFEFVQQNWINNPAFGGLHAERDPLIGERRSGEDLLTIQANAVRERLTGIDRFVTVKGGDYFFLPSLSALRYLAELVPETAGHSVAARVPVQNPSVAVPAALPVPRLGQVLRSLAFVLPALTLTWALRFPILLAAALLLAPLGALGAPGAIGMSFFLTGRTGLVLVGAMASLAASVVMITARLVLMYGERVGLTRSRWHGPARWSHVLVFQMLALPIAIACMHWSAVDAAWMPDVASNTPSYWRHMGHLAPAAILGIVLGVLLLDAATWIQALRPGSRPDLMFPSGGLLGARRHQLPRQGFFSRQLTRLSNALVDQVPPSIGAGYIDYATRRVLPGHAFAFALATITCAAYAAGYVALNPAWSSLAGRFPSIAYVLLLLIAGGWLLAAAGFFLDRYRLSTLVVIGVWLLITLSIANTDHYFPVGPAQATAVAPRDALRSAQARNPEQRERIVVVMSEGLGVMSSAWTAEVLARLARHDVIGDRFTRSIRLLSASSGASLGTLHFVNGYASDGFRRDRLGTMTADAASPSSGEGAWGIAYPDLLRPWLPLVVPKYVDRGWAMEQAWKRALGDPEPKLADWQRDTAEGWRPATAFGVTVVESGEHALLATYRTGRHDVTAGLDVSMVTAARLSAAFPFVSPPARGDLRSDQGTEASFHLLDSGMSDNSGWTAVRDWLEAVHDDLHDVNVMIVDIRSLPPRRASAPTEDNAWTLELTAPLRALLEVRLARHEGVSREIEAFNRWWQATHERPLQHVTFALGETAAPLTWNLGRADAGRLQRALQRNEPSVSRVCAFLNGDEPCHK